MDSLSPTSSLAFDVHCFVHLANLTEMKSQSCFDFHVIVLGDYLYINIYIMYIHIYTHTQIVIKGAMNIKREQRELCGVFGGGERKGKLA